MKRLAFLTIAVFAFCAAATFTLSRKSVGPRSSRPLIVLCAAELREPVLAVVERYRRETGVEVRLEFGAEETQLSRFRARGQGDLVITAGGGTLADARRTETIREVIPIALRSPSVGRSKGGGTADPGEVPGRAETADAAVLAASQQPTSALHFARYLAAPEKGGVAFAEHGFASFPGDAWADRPELILYSGGVNRPAIEGLLREFAEREGATLTTVFNGCGILCASMKAMTNSSNPRFPDAYYACDLCFVPPVAKQFPEAVILTETDIGIAVHKGNPRDVRTLTDLARPGLRVGLCNAEQSTLGYLTRGLLRRAGLGASVRANVAVEVPTADFLINQLRAGGLDAAIVYRVNAAPQSEHLDYLPLPQAEARAVQPFSIRGDSPHKQLAARLLDLLRANRSRFEAAGFQWRGDEAPVQSANIRIPQWLLAPP